MDEPVTAPTLKISGHSATLTCNRCGWTLTREVRHGEGVVWDLCPNCPNCPPPPPYQIKRHFASDEEMGTGTEAP